MTQPKLPSGVPEVDFGHYGVTRYFPIPLGGDTPTEPVTGVFFPRGYSYPDEIDLVLYLHGKKYGFSTINEYWRADYYNGRLLLREEVHAGSREVALVAPTLGYHPGEAKGAGVLSEQRPKGDWYLEQVMAAIKEAEPRYKDRSPRVGKVILACHSAGGVPMRQLATAAFGDRLKQCWGFDCLYSQDDPQVWAAWGRARPSITLQLFIAYASSTEGHSLALQTAVQKPRLESVRVEPAQLGKFPFSCKSVRGIGEVVTRGSGEVCSWATGRHPSQFMDHFDVPIAYFRSLLNDAWFLTKK